MPELDRTIFETSRALEYFNVRELQAQTGQPRENFITVAFKELMDNALDACETARVAPRITVKVEETEGTVTFSVSDNGTGIHPDTIKKILNFDTRTSDKTVYRSPTRGAQGNALKTILGMPFALGCTEPIIIIAHSVRHEIQIWADPGGELRINHEKSRTPCTRRRRSRGTFIQVTFPTEDQDYNLPYWARSFALFNPHATIEFSMTRNKLVYPSDEISDSYNSTTDFPSDWRKYLPSDHTSPWWYDVADLERLIFSHIGETKRGNRDFTLREFVSQFKGLTGVIKSKRVCDQFPDIKRLSDFDSYALEETNTSEVGRLLSTMKESTKAPSPNTLGFVGESHFKKCFSEWFGVKEMAYKKISRKLEDGRPFVAEIALAEELSKTFEEDPSQKEFFHGINFSPTYEDPLADVKLKGHDGTAYGLTSFMKDAYALGKPVLVHLIYPF